MSHGIVTPIVSSLGWDSADPHQMVPELAIPRGRVDFALLRLGKKPAVFIEVKGVGRAAEADRQLFEYAFHEGVPLCVLTDGREWSFYLPAAQGSYDERRLYRLQLDDRDPAECERVLQRYLAYDRIRSGVAREDAFRDFQDAAGQREAVTALPRAWLELLAEPEQLLIDIVGDKAEALCGFKPSVDDVTRFLRRLTTGEVPAVYSTAPARMASQKVIAVPAAPIPPASASPAATTKRGAPDQAAGTITATLLGKSQNFENATFALVEVLRTITALDAAKIPELAELARGRTRSHIARSAAEINPLRPDLAKSAEFASGWLVGLNISNEEKMRIIRKACVVYGLRVPEDVDVAMPNA
ncbi:hypothetical protein [Sphingomonas sp. ID0503]|uniref:hypothetical protein n=1 Tax=Sphingomonas sp. ID0503 TaxID=3399691 RepID=UPI003AFA5B46